MVRTRRGVVRNEGKRAVLEMTDALEVALCCRTLPGFDWQGLWECSEPIGLRRISVRFQFL